MAQPSLESFKRRGFTLKLEGTEGVDSVPTAGTDGFDLFDGTSETAFDAVERMRDRPFFTNDPFGIARRRAMVNGSMELIPPAVPGTGAMSGALALRIAGMTQVLDAVGPPATTRYNPISAGIVSATGYWYHNEHLLRILGIRANLTGLSMEIGQRFMAQVQFMGKYLEMDEVALPAITLPNENIAPTIVRPENSRTRITTLDSPASATDLMLRAKGLSVDFNNQLDLKEYTEFSSSTISERKATFTTRVARLDLGDLNLWAIRDAGSLLTINLRLTEADGRYSELGVRGQIENIQQVDIDQDHGYEITGRCIASSAGGDELYVEFGDGSS